MARITVEDCVLKVPNRFELVLLAAQRAREVASGSPLTIERDNDKNPVVSLREIADGTITVDDMQQHLLQNLQKHVEKDEPEEDNPDLLSVGDELIGLESRRSLIDEEIADDVLTVGGQVLIGADEDEGEVLIGESVAESDVPETPEGPEGEAEE